MRVKNEYRKNTAQTADFESNIKQMIDEVKQNLLYLQIDIILENYFVKYIEQGFIL